jgi:nitrate reductase NapAB chaperone NapD
MAVCSYLIITRTNATDRVLARLNALEGCEAVRAENREVILLVTETASPDDERTLRQRVEAIEEIASAVLTFGELDDSAPLVQLQGSGPRRGA